MEYTSCVHALALKLFVLLALASLQHRLYAYDPAPLQDFCVATDDPKETLFVNGKFCKDPRNVTADDFFYPRIDNTIGKVPTLGINYTEVNVTNLPGLNTLGISMTYVEYAPKAVAPPLIILRASRILVVLEGTLLVGFVASNQNGNRLFTKTLQKGDVFALPIGLIHIQKNVGSTRAVSLIAAGSQSAGFISIPSSVFGSTPPIPQNLLSKAFQLDKNIIEYLQNVSWP